MFGKKGQAFDTFKLMIAAVVAVAILGILLTILGGLPDIGGNPPTIIREQLSTAYQNPGSTSISPTEAQFKANTEYVEASFLSSVGGAGWSITFVCESDLGEACDDSVEGVLTIDSDFKAKVRACCSTDSSECAVGIGTTADISGSCT